MNLNKMLATQAELDKFTLGRSGVKEYPFNQIMLALRVELGELAQEWGEFKYWKKSRKETDKAALIEEWADCMHFTLSLHSNNAQMVCEEAVTGITNFYIEEFDIYEMFDRAFVHHSLSILIALGLRMGFSDEELEQAYFSKNKKNWERMKGDY